MSDIKMWVRHGDRWNILTENIDESSKTLPSGAYYVTYQDGNHGPSPVINTHKWGELHEPFKMKEWDDARKWVYEFFDSMNLINSFDFIAKTGLLFHGKAGSGKTSFMNWTAKHLIEDHNAIVFYMSNALAFHIAWESIQDTRASQDNPFVIILDECEELLQERERFAKQVLDGVDSVDRCLFLMATNYFDTLPKTITERESRIRHIIQVDGITSKEEIINVIKKLMAKNDKVDYSDIDLEAEAEAFLDKNATIDNIKTSFINYLITGTMAVERKEERGIGFKS